jgi:hypothetical protein
VPKEKEAFQRKYGLLPKPPAPPAPPVVSANGERILPEAPKAPELELAEIPEKPEAPEKPELAELPGKPEAPERPEPAEVPEKPEAPEIAEVPEAPVPPPAPAQVDCFNKKGYCVTIADNQGECVVIVKDKSNKIVEAVSLTDWDKDKRYEEKYGETPSRRWLPKHVMGRSMKKVTRVEEKAKPSNVKRVTILELKPVTRVETKPAPAVNEKKVITLKLKPATSLETKREYQYIREQLKNDTVIIADNSKLVWVRRKLSATVVPARSISVKPAAEVKVSATPVVKTVERVKVTPEAVPATKPVPANPEKDQ